MDASDGTNPNENNPNRLWPNDQRKSKGRQKLKMEKIENEKNLQVTFSKRRAGIFKKASELNTLCGAESVVVVLSPGGKIHSYGHPSLETIANRFLNTNVGPTPPVNSFFTAQQEVRNQQLNQELDQLEELLIHEREKKKELDQSFQPRINEKSYEELNQLQESVLRFKSIFDSRLKVATSSGSGPGPSVGFTNPSGFEMGYPNAGDPTHWVTGSSSYPAPFDPNMGYMVPYPYDVDPFWGTTTTTSNVESDDEVEVDVPNMTRGQMSGHSDGHGKNY